MGYRSDVYIKGTLNTFGSTMQVVKNHDLVPDSLSSDEDYFCMTFIEYRWYEGYEFVDDFTALFKSYEESNTHLLAAIRQGEDPDDTETYGTDLYDVDMSYTKEIIVHAFDTEDAPDKLKADYPEYFI